MHGLHTDRTAQVVIAGHAFVQNLRRGHYELEVDASPALRVAAAFTELAWQSDSAWRRSTRPPIRNATTPYELYRRYSVRPVEKLASPNLNKFEYICCPPKNAPGFQNNHSCSIAAAHRTDPLPTLSIHSRTEINSALLPFCPQR